MRKLLITITAVLAIASTSAHADQRFLRAAAFFLNGSENGLKYQVATDGTEMMSSESMAILVFQDKSRPCTVHYIDVITDKLRIANGSSNLLTAMTVDFDQIPSPRDFGYSHFGGGIGGGPQQSWYTSLPADAMIETTVKHEKDDSVSFPPTGRRWKSFKVRNARQLTALDFIRSNYCAGLPEVRGF